MEGDPDLLEEVLVNLLDNAVKYSPAGGGIDMSGSVDGRGKVTVMVSDSGVGVPRWETRRIFERFHRSQNPNSTHPRGMGLGLYICDEIMKAHGGGVSVTDNEGGGSVFILTFPDLGWEW